MGIADFIRVMRGNLTPEEIAERDAAARLRREQAEREAAEQLAAKQAAKAAAAEYAESEAGQFGLLQQRLFTAGGISTLHFVCHDDTWEFIKNWMNRGRYTYWWDAHQYSNRVSLQPGNMLTVRLSGPQLAEIIDRLAWASRVSGVQKPYQVAVPDRREMAVAGRIYDAIGQIVDQIDPDAPRDRAVPPVVLDDRPAEVDEQGA